MTYKRFRATLTYTPKACEKCGVVNENYTVTKNGTKTSTIKLGNILFQPYPDGNNERIAIQPTTELPETDIEEQLDPIRNTFVYTLSNGHREGINNKIKIMKRSGYGYRNFYNFRARILISFNLREDSSKRIRPLYRKDEKQ